MEVKIGVEGTSMRQKHFIFRNLDKCLCLLFVLTGLILTSIFIGIGQTNTSHEAGSVTKLEGGGDTWRQMTDMPNARRNLAAEVVARKVYAIGGSTSLDPWATTVEVYDPVTDTWQSRAPMPTARQYLDAVMVNDKIYALGGQTYEHNFLATMEVYDPITDTWQSRIPMPTARGGFGMAAVGGKIFAIGGRDSNTIFTAVEAYDPVTDTWQSRAPMPTPRTTWATVLNDKIYAIGGGNSGKGEVYVPGASQLLDIVEVYDPITNTWQSRTPMPTARGGFGMAAINGKIYVIGGWNKVNGDLQALATVEEYDPATDTWRRLSDMPTARLGIAMGIVNGRIYVIGGSDLVQILSTVEEFTPPSVESRNWLTGWAYRKRHTIQGSSVEPVANYQIRFTVHYGSGADSGADVYLNANCRPDFGDVRFTRSDGQTELDYWLEEKVDRNYARYWVEVTSIPASPSTTTIYVYYGNSGATTTSNGPTTFQFFEPFTNFDSNKWRLSKNYVEALQYWGYTIEDGTLVLYIGTRGKSKLFHGGFGTFYQYPFLLVNHTLAIRMKAQKKNEGDWGEGKNLGIGFNDTSTRRTWGRGGTYEHKYTKGFEMLWSSGTWDGSMTPYETRELRITASQVKVFHNGLYQFTETVSISGPQSIWIQIDLGDAYSLDAWGELYVDWVFLRNYVDPEPSHGSWGGEEGGEAPTVMVLSPNGGEAWKGIQSIMWTATDPQADPLIYTVYYSPNGGTTWTQLATGLTEPSYQWDTTKVMDGGNNLIKVEANDGEYIRQDISDATFEIANVPITTTTPAPLTTTITETVPEPETTSPTPVTTPLTTTPSIPATAPVSPTLLVVLGLGLVAGLGGSLWVWSKRRAGPSEPVPEGPPPTERGAPIPVQEYDPDVALATLKQLATVYERVAWQTLMDEFHFTDDIDLQTLLFRAGLSGELEVKIDEMTKMVRLQVVEAAEPLMPKKFACPTCGAALEPHESSCPACGSTFPSCIICRRPVQANLTKTPCCGAYAHEPHLKEWIRIRGTCPMCREKLSDWMLP